MECITLGTKIKLNESNGSFEHKQNLLSTFGTSSCFSVTGSLSSEGKNIKLLHQHTHTL